MDQVGVKAPGRPTMIMFFPLAYSAMSMVSGSGKPWKSLAEGSLSPAATLRAVAERAFDTEGAKAAALPARAAVRRSFMAVVLGFIQLLRRTSAQKWPVVGVNKQNKDRDADRRSTDVLATAYPSQAALQQRIFRDCLARRERGQK